MTKTKRTKRTNSHTKSNSEKNGEKEKEIPVVMYRKNGVHVEVVYNEDTGIADFWQFDLDGNGNPKSMGRPVMDNKHFDEPIIPSPRLSDFCKRGFMYLAEKPAEYNSENNAQELWNKTISLILEYIDIDGLDAFATTQYVGLTYVYEKLESLPYLRFLGIHGTGKTQMLSVLAALTYRSLFFQSPTEAVLFRTINELAPTLIVDEADFDYKTATAISRILNGGYKRRGGGVLRCHGDEHEVRAFTTFGPKILANREPFSDPALESRCITVHTDRSHNRPLILDQSFYDRATELRNQWLWWRVNNYHRVFTIDKDIVSVGVEPRTKQIMGILYSIRPDGRLIDYTLTVDKRINMATSDSEDAWVLAELAKQIKPTTTFVGYKLVGDELDMHPKTVGRILTKKLKLPKKKTAQQWGVPIDKRTKEVIKKQLLAHGITSSLSSLSSQKQLEADEQSSNSNGENDGNDKNDKE